jgi:hypothetical protein
MLNPWRPSYQWQAVTIHFLDAPGSLVVMDRQIYFKYLSFKRQGTTLDIPAVTNRQPCLHRQTATHIISGNPYVHGDPAG